MTETIKSLQNVWKYRLTNTATASFDATRQMTKVCQRKNNSNKAWRPAGARTFHWYVLNGETKNNGPDHAQRHFHVAVDNFCIKWKRQDVDMNLRKRRLWGARCNRALSLPWCTTRRCKWHLLEGRFKIPKAKFKCSSKPLTVRLSEWRTAYKCSREAWMGKVLCPVQTAVSTQLLTDRWPVFRNFTLTNSCECFTNNSELVASTVF